MTNTEERNVNSQAAQQAEDEIDLIAIAKTCGPAARPF